MALKWNQQYAFPLIARFIEQKSDLSGEFIARDTLAAALLANPEAGSLIQDRARRKGNKSPEWHAGNMVDWFSKKYTEHLNGKVDFDYARFIERERATKSDTWAYRIRADLIRADLYAGEISDASGFLEGATVPKYVNAYERNKGAREECISHYGKACAVCLKTLEEVYGPCAEKLIHVHHLRPLSTIGQQYVVDPVNDLRPVCPNCHAVIHLRPQPYTISEVQAFMEDAKKRKGKQ